MKFEQAVEIILKHEGGEVNDPKDPGGHTKYGISKRAYPHLDIASLTVDDAKAIYFADYWEPLKMMLLPRRVRLCLFDCAVNQGLSRAIRILQAACGASQDGVLGPKTIAAAHNMGDLILLKGILAARARHYFSISGFTRFGLGWTIRLLLIAVDSISGEETT
jgi:lysozyme family protein